MTKRIALSVLALMLGLLIASPTRPQETQDRRPSWDDYRIIVEKNVFLPERSRPSRRNAVTVVPEYRPERDIILRGIVSRGGEYVAFLENTRTQSTSKLKVADAVARGRIAAISLDRITYERDGETFEVTVGERLETAPPAPPAPAAPSADAADTGEAASSISPEATPSAPGTGTDAERAILERLRQRRQEESK